MSRKRKKRIPTPGRSLRCQNCGTRWTKDELGELSTASKGESEAPGEPMSSKECPACRLWGEEAPIYYATVRWAPIDVLNVAADQGVRMTLKRAEGVLQGIERSIQDRMTEEGYAVIADLLPYEDGE